jgi:hypothetical protein
VRLRKSVPAESLLERLRASGGPDIAGVELN